MYNICIKVQLILSNFNEFFEFDVPAQSSGTVTLRCTRFFIYLIKSVTYLSWIFI